jgi:hypothetical protein
MKSQTQKPKQSKLDPEAGAPAPRSILSLRKPPESAAHHHWRRERDGVSKFLDKLDGSVEIHGIRWVERMRKHYTERLKTLNRNEPK